MTIAISLKVNDGIVLASDSATTMILQGQTGANVVNIYNNANKIFNIHKSIPVGVITWGIGSIGKSSISTLVKDFRSEIGSTIKIDVSNYSVDDVFNKFIKYMHEGHYLTNFSNITKKPDLGFMVCGYSTGKSLAEEYRFVVVNGNVVENKLIRKDADTGVTWNGEPEAITRLIFGFSNMLPNVLKNNGYKDDEIGKLMNALKGLQIPFVNPAMPIQDAIDLAIFLVETTINFSKFSPGAPTVGGPIEVAAITKHENFKWIKRKHYYDVDLNIYTTQGRYVR